MFNLNFNSLQVFTDEQLAKLLDRSDLSWRLGEEKKEPVKCEKAVNGLFRVIDQDDKKPDLGSVKDKQQIHQCHALFKVQSYVKM